MSKTITIFGATGNQGGSVVSAILNDEALSQEYKIHGVTRDTARPKAQELVKKGVELVNADLNSKESLVEIFKGSDSVFLLTDYWITAKLEDEIAQGKNVADAAKEAGVKQIIFSSLIDVTEATHGRLKNTHHFDGKAEIERYIRSTGITCTFVMPGYYMSNLTGMIKKQEDGLYNLVYPVSRKAKFPLLDISADYGKFVLPALRNPEQWDGKQIYAADDYYTVNEIISIFEEVTGNKLNFEQVSNEQYKSTMPAYMAQEMLENHLLFEEPGYYAGASLKESHDALTSKTTTWKEFVAKTPAFHH